MLHESNWFCYELPRRLLFSFFRILSNWKIYQLWLTNHVWVGCKILSSAIFLWTAFVLLRLGVRECLELVLLTVLADDSVELTLAERDKRLGVSWCATGGMSDASATFSGSSEWISSCGCFKKSSGKEKSSVWLWRQAGTVQPKFSRMSPSSSKFLNKLFTFKVLLSMTSRFRK